jgi:hypothetical protein
MSYRKPRIVNPPPRIWLNYGELFEDNYHARFAGTGEVTWCRDQQNSTDVEYRLVRPSRHKSREKS